MLRFVSLSGRLVIASLDVQVTTMRAFLYNMMPIDTMRVRRQMPILLILNRHRTNYNAYLSRQWGDILICRFILDSAIVSSAMPMGTLSCFFLETRITIYYDSIQNQKLLW